MTIYTLVITEQDDDGEIINHIMHLDANTATEVRDLAEEFWPVFWEENRRNQHDWEDEDFVGLKPTPVIDMVCFEGRHEEAK